MTAHKFRYYCDICNEASAYTTLEEAREMRENHFKDIHPDNPMVKQNARIQRR